MRNPKEQLLYNNKIHSETKTIITTTTTTNDNNKMETNHDIIEENDSKQLTTTTPLTEEITTTVTTVTTPTTNEDNSMTLCHNELSSALPSNNGLTTKIESINLNESSSTPLPLLSSSSLSSLSLTNNINDDKSQQSKLENIPTSGVNLSNLINKIECDIKSDTSSNLNINLNISKTNQDVVINNNDDNIVVESKKKNFIDIEDIIIPPQPLHPDTYLNFPHYIDYNNFSTNYSNPSSQNAISANKINKYKDNASSALALHNSNNYSIKNSILTNINNTNNMQSLSLSTNIIENSNNITTIITETTTTNPNTNTMTAYTINNDNHNNILFSTSSSKSNEFNDEKNDDSLTTKSSLINDDRENYITTISKLSSDDQVTESTSISLLTNKSSINNDNNMQCTAAFNQNDIKFTQNLQESSLPNTTTIITEQLLLPTPLISVTIHPPQSFIPNIAQNHHYNSLAITSSNNILSNTSNYHNDPFINSPASTTAINKQLQMQKSTSQQLNASNASNASSLKFQDNILAYKRYLFSPKTQSLDLGSDLEHPAVLRYRNPRLHQEERFFDDSLTLNDVNDMILKSHNKQNNTKTETISNNMIPTSTMTSTTVTTATLGMSTSSNGDLRREILQRNTDEAILNAGRLSPSISYTTSSTSSTSNYSTMSTGESDTPINYNPTVATTTSASSPSSDIPINSSTILKPKLQAALESRPIYPNVPYSPYSSPRSRRRPPLRESRRVSIDKSGSFLQLNQYKLMDQIGQGSYGLVKLAYNEEDSTHYAMKILSKRRLLRKAGLMSRGPKKTTQSPLDRVYREIAVLKKLDHPNVVKLIEVLDDPLEDFLYLVFELVHQGEVLCIPTDKPLNEERAWSVFRDALQGLEYLHYQRIIHADIKPGNLLLGEGGQVKIADLGVCNEFLGEDAAMNNGSTAGTPAFRAPETLMPGQYIYSGKAADIWALGATLWSLIYGNVPFVANNIPALYEQIKNDPLIFPDNPKICDELKDLLEKILDKNPNKRITLPQIKEHSWVTTNDKYPLPSEEENCRLVQVSDEDMNCVVKSIPKLDTLILIKTMLKNHSFQHPFAKSGISGRAPQRGGSRLERFTRAGRSNSAPGAYHSPLDRQLSSENTLPSLSENVTSPSNESSDKLLE